MLPHARLALPRLGFVALLCGVVLLSSACFENSDHTFKLDLDPAGLKYQAFLDYGGGGYEPNDTRAQTFLMADLEGDGIPELVNGDHQKILGMDMGDGRRKPVFEFHLADDQCLDDEGPLTGFAKDFNGDGIDEIYMATRALDYSNWHFQVLDPAANAFTLDVLLPIGEDRRRPYYWDGSYVVTGALDDADGEGNPGVVLIRRVGYDASLRGVYVVSPFTGQVIWEYVCGAQPAGHSAFVKDLDGDGRKEIGFFSSSPDNLNGRMINGTTDNQAHLIVLSNHGEELMIRTMGSAFFNGNVRVHDLDDDGFLEIITTTYNGSIGRSNEIVVWDWKDKEVLTRTRSTAFFLGLAIVPGPRPATTWLVAGSDDGSINRFLYENGTLVRDKVALRDHPRCHISGEADILPEPGPEIIADLEEGNLVAILSHDLRPLAVLADESGQEKHFPSVWPSPKDDPALVMGSSRAWWAIKFYRTPTDWAGLIRKVGLGAILLMALVSMFIAGRIAGRRSRRVEAHQQRLSEATDRDALFRLQRELEDVNHQVVGRTKGLERLVWLLDASATGLGNQEELKARIEQVMYEFRETVHPRLLVILRLARQANFETDLVEDTTLNLESLYARIQRLTDEGLDPGRIALARERLRSDWEAVRDGFLALRTSVAGYFTTDPVRMLRGMLLVREGDLERGRIDGRLIGDLKDPAGTLCHIDHGDLHFVLENLVDNAIRAMRSSPSRNLILQVERKEGEVALHVSDSGTGIPPEHVDKIFSGRFSTRPGGGLGLHRSREILVRWGGEIQLVHSFPGKGTTFIVKLSTAGDPAALKSLSARG